MVLWLVWSAALLLGAYLLGSIATGYWLGYALKGIDIRQHGSGSTGATNVLRTLGKGPAIAVLLIDMLKGRLAVLLIGPGLVWASERFLPAGVVDFALWSDWLRALAGLAALIGHSKSPWIGFTGGKSVASSLGVLLALHWPVALGTLGVFAAVLSLSQIVSLSSIVGAIAVTVFMIAFRQPVPYLLFAIAGGVYVIVRHRTNIQRLVAGTEPRIGQKSSQGPT